MKVSTISFSPSTVFGSTSTSCTVTLTNPAGNKGAVVSLTNTNPNYVFAPSSVTIPSGQQSTTFSVATGYLVSAQTATVTASFGGQSASAVLTVTGPAVTSVTFNPTSVAAGGATTTGTVTLDHVHQGPGGAIELTSLDPSHVTVPNFAYIFAGQQQATFTATTTSQQVAAATPVTITARFATTGSGSITVTPCSASRAPLAPAGALTDTVWIDDAYPAGATASGATWDSGQSSLGTQALTPGYAAGYHSLSISGATSTINAAASDSLFVDLLLTTCATPTEVEFGWHTATGWKRAYYGPAQIGNESGALSLGALPSQRGSWIRVSVDPTALGLAGQSIDGFSLDLPNGQAWVDRIGKTCIYSAVQPPPSIPVTDMVWVDDAVPAGATTVNATFTTAQHASGAQAIVLGPSASNAYFYFSGSNNMQWLTLGMDRKIVLYALVNPCAPPSGIRVWGISADYMGSVSANWGTGGQAEDIQMGPVPAAGSWVRLEIPVPSNSVGKELNQFGITITNGQAWFDSIGLTSPSCPAVAAAPTLDPNNYIWADDGNPFWWDKYQHASGTSSLSFLSAAPGLHITAAAGVEAMPAYNGDSLGFWVLLNECTPPTEIGVRWLRWGTNPIDGGWWGASHGAYEGNMMYMGPLPAAGVWTWLEIPASAISAVNQNINGVYFYTWDGQAWYDGIGKSGCMMPAAAAPTIPSGDTVWADDTIASGWTLYDGLWTQSQHAAGTKSLTSSWNYPLNYVSLRKNVTFAAGDKIVFYGLVDSCVPASEIQLNVYRDGPTSTKWTAYWGAANGYEPANALNMGPLPSPGTWTRFEVPVSSLGVAGELLYQVEIAIGNGRAYVDHIGSNP